MAGTEIVLAQAGISHSGSGVGAGSRCRASPFPQSIRQVPSIPSPGQKMCRECRSADEGWLLIPGVLGVKGDRLCAGASL